MSWEPRFEKVRFIWAVFLKVAIKNKHVYFCGNSFELKLTQLYGEAVTKHY